MCMSGYPNHIAFIYLGFLPPAGCGRHALGRSSILRGASSPPKPGKQLVCVEVPVCVITLHLQSQIQT